MKRIFLLIFLLCFPAIAFSQPSIEFNTEAYDFGTVPPGEKIEHVFDFKNTGNEELIIERISHSWGCAAVVASSSHLKPGEEGKIVATVNIQGKVGFISKTVKVSTNDPKRPTINLVVKALIKVPPVSQ
jgi:hypothetical protein